MVTTLFINFSDAQGQLTPKSVMESCRNSNPSKFLWLVLLSTRMKRIHPKMKVLSILNGSSSFLHTISTTIKAWMSLNFGKIPLLTLELAALKRQKN